MKVTIDGAGRVVIPKPIRDAMGLRGGTVLEIRVRGDRVEIVPAPSRIRLERRGRFVVAVAEDDLPPLTPEMVEEIREKLHDERADV